MNLQTIWTALEESYGVCADASAPAIEKFAEESHLSSGYWSWGPAIILFPDETISSAQWMRIFPYGIPQTINGRLASATEGGYLVQDGDGFRSTEKEKPPLIKACKRWPTALPTCIPFQPMTFNGSWIILFDYPTRRLPRPSRRPSFA